MFQIKKKHIKEKSIENNITGDKNRPLNICCLQHPKHSPFLWILLLILSAFWVGVVASIISIVVLPELKLDIPLKWIAMLAVLFWIILVFGVWSHIHRLNNVSKITFNNGDLTIYLSNQKSHIYDTNKTIIYINRVKSFDNSNPIKNNHFKMIVKDSQKKIIYDVLAEDEDEFLKFIKQIHSD